MYYNFKKLTAFLVFFVKKMCPMDNVTTSLIRNKKAHRLGSGGSSQNRSKTTLCAH